MSSSNLLLGLAATVFGMGKTLNQVLADNLRARMGDRWTQSSLSKRSGVAQTTISLYLSPERRSASATGREPSAKLAEIEKLAAALECSPLDLLTDGDQQPLLTTECVVEMRRRGKDWFWVENLIRSALDLQGLTRRPLKESA